MALSVSAFVICPSLPSSLRALIRVFASLVELEGQFDDSKGAPSFTLRVDGKRPTKALSAEPFRAAAVPLDVVLVIESSALYGVQKIAAPSNLAPAPTKPSKRKGKPARNEKPAD